VGTYVVREERTVRTKLTLLTGVAVGYVLGAKAGRRRYEQIKARANAIWHDPRVQDKVGDVEETVRARAGEVGGSVLAKAPDMQHKVTELVRELGETLQSGRNHSSAPGQHRGPSDQSSGTSTGPV